MINNEFLAQMMKEHKITYREIASRLNFKSPGTVWKWLHGRTHMKAMYIEQLSAMFDVPVQSFFTNVSSEQIPCGGGDCDEL